MGWIWSDGRIPFHGTQAGIGWGGCFQHNGSEMIYEYNLTDHASAPLSTGLGNTRITFGDADADGLADILQENHYYPFGMAMTMSSTLAAAPPNNYLYNGKELQDELDLGWYDYGARMYDASIGRWNGVDALAEMYVGWSPYNYVMGNPIGFIDPDGMRTDWVIDGDRLYFDPNIDSKEKADAKGVEYVGPVVVIRDEGDNSGRMLFGDHKGILHYYLPSVNIVDFQPLKRGDITPSEKDARVPDPRYSAFGKTTNALSATEQLIEEVYFRHSRVIFEQSKRLDWVNYTVDTPSELVRYGTRYMSAENSHKLVSALDKASKVLSPTAMKIIGSSGILATVADGAVNGFEFHHYADMAIGAAFTFVPAIGLTAGLIFLALMLW